ncbi:hypothetical protein ACFPRL_26485 [Pseudoclavibacter helvolus]
MRERWYLPRHATRLCSCCSTRATPPAPRTPPGSLSPCVRGRPPRRATCGRATPHCDSRTPSTTKRPDSTPVTTRRRGCSDSSKLPGEPRARSRSASTSAVARRQPCASCR